jgi:hypothetical protein
MEEDKKVKASRRYLYLPRYLYIYVGIPIQYIYLGKGIIYLGRVMKVI